MTLDLLAKQIALAVILCIGFAKNGVGASFSVSPVGFSLTAQRTSGVLQISNTSDDPVRVQVSVVDWDNDGRKETLIDTDDLLLNPPIFSLEPGQTQYLRFGLRQPLKTSAEKSYRLLIDEVPPSHTQATALRMLLRISIPVFIAPKEKQEKITWELRQEPSGVILIAFNDGNVHTKIHQIKLSSAGNKDDVSITTPAYVLPGQHKEWLLANGKIRVGKIHLKIQTDKGQIEENLTLESAQIRSSR